MRYVPLSIRSAPLFSRRRLGWWLKSRRQSLALKLAPWLDIPPFTYRVTTVERCLYCGEVHPVTSTQGGRGVPVKTCPKAPAGSVYV